MPRATTGRVHRKRAKKILKDTKGFIGARSTIFRTAKDARRRALQNSFIDRRRKKRDFRALWIIRIAAAARLCGISYSKFIAGLKTSNIEINRKMLADIAARDMNAFRKIVDKVKETAA
ncbi:MAG TPA: 50S ribosomal protein L20 [Spirochaetota bacterium]|nr:50S ribosomal protein L20 [Spirochaetota bacterium]HPC40975.1 50S ribosomal protein L20 [Spirochaetota bacterium]HPL18306.1 50S ribosomal protein L20 [Spirochaetota bacterium]HQF08594.1 50S ribosomal protein L20 [Spirochaetota bacterium]HQH97309.1 50S ribosomal protein L20 [Spirochaetota bacterium]